MQSYAGFFIFGFYLLQAILGGTIHVPTLTGDVVLKVCVICSRQSLIIILILVDVPSGYCSIKWECEIDINFQVRPGTQPGQKVVLKRKGENSNLYFLSLTHFLLLIVSSEICVSSRDKSRPICYFLH